MGSDLTIGDTCYVTDGAHSKVKRQENGILYLTSKNITNGELKLDKVDWISEVDYNKLFSNTAKSQRRLQTGDVLMGIIGTFGNAYLYKEDDKFGISSSVAILRSEQNKLIPEFLYYVVTSEKFKRTVEAYKGGSVQGYTNISTLKSLPIPNVPLSEQINSVKVLSSLDNKIQLNKQINQTLEKMAQTLFKSWFVDFDPVIDNMLDAIDNGEQIEIPEALTARVAARKAQRTSVDALNPQTSLPAEIRQLFPSRFEHSEEASIGIRGWVPEGWGVMTLSQISERIGDGLHGTPKYDPDGEYYFINGNNLENCNITYKDSTKKVSKSEYIKHKKELTSDYGVNS